MLSGVALLAAIAVIAALVFVSRRLGRVEGRRDDVEWDLYAWERFREVENEPTDDLDEDALRDLMRDRL
jgi:hypothetical protein